MYGGTGPCDAMPGFKHGSGKIAARLNPPEGTEMLHLQSKALNWAINPTQ